MPLCRFPDLVSINIAPSVRILLLEDTVGRMRRDTLVFAFVVSFVPFDAGIVLLAALLAFVCFYERVLRAGASVSAVILTTARRLLRCFAFLLVDVVTTCFSTLGATRTCSLKAVRLCTLVPCYVTNPMDRVYRLVGSVLRSGCIALLS